MGSVDERYLSVRVLRVNLTLGAVRDVLGGDYPYFCKVYVSAAALEEARYCAFVNLTFNVAVVLCDLADLGNNADVIGCGEYVVITSEDKIGAHLMGPMVIFDVFNPWKSSEKQVQKRVQVLDFVGNGIQLAR